MSNVYTAERDEQVRYPIGAFQSPKQITRAEISEWIRDISRLPAILRDAVSNLDSEQLETSYRPGGWTARQVVHHLADSHMNSYVRFRLALTEDSPLIKPYDESAWAVLPDAKSAPVDVSLHLLEALHGRWVLLLKALTEQQFKTTYRHPALGTTSLAESLALYAWHGRHHVAQITGLRQRQGW